MPKHQIFKMQNNILLVPHWIEEELHRQGESLKVVLDFPTMRRIFSMNDLIGFLVCQKFGESVFCTKDVVSDPNGVVFDWMTTATEKADKEYIERNLSSFVEDKKRLEEIESRLFKPGPATYATPGYSVVPIEDTHLAVVIQAGAFNPENAAGNAARLANDTLKQLYVYEDASLVAGSSLMRKHLTNLSRQS